MHKNQYPKALKALRETQRSTIRPSSNSQGVFGPEAVAIWDATINSNIVRLGPDLFEGVLTLKTNIYRTMHIEVDDKSNVIIYNGKDSEERICPYIDTYI